MTEHEMVGWHHRFNGHEAEQTPGHSEGQGDLACCSPWRHKESDTAERLNNNNTHITAWLVYRIWQSDARSPWRLGYKRTWGFNLGQSLVFFFFNLLSFSHLYLLAKPATKLYGHLSYPVKKPTWQGTEVSKPWQVSPATYTCSPSCSLLLTHRNCKIAFVV